jgi:hypothetical protein
VVLVDCRAFSLQRAALALNGLPQTHSSHWFPCTLELADTRVNSAFEQCSGIVNCKTHLGNTTSLNGSRFPIFAWLLTWNETEKSLNQRHPVCRLMCIQLYYLERTQTHSLRNSPSGPVRKHLCVWMSAFSWHDHNRAFVNAHTVIFWLEPKIKPTDSCGKRVLTTYDICDIIIRAVQFTHSKCLNLGSKI